MSIRTTNFLLHPYVIITSRVGVLRVTYKRDFGLDLLTPYTFTSRDYRQLQRYRYSTYFTVHRLIRTEDSQSSLAVSWQRIYQSHCNFKSHDVFFSQFNSFLAIILQLPTPFNSKLISRQAGVSNSTRLLRFYSTTNVLWDRKTDRERERERERERNGW
jgi:hypothetical protein